jgi:DNA-binding helix-hairpin-helix protein with protein kinase domain
VDQSAQVWETQEQERERRDATRIQQLQTQQHNEAARITMALNRRLKEIDTSLADLPRKEHERRNSALAPLQRSHIQDRLRRTSVQEAGKLSNMGAKSIDALVSVGIRTAADFTGVHFVTGGGYGNVTAYFVLSSGQRTRVPGVGEKRARALESWRQGIESRARQTAPVKLSAAELQSLTARTAADRTRLQGGRKKAEADAQAQRDQLQQRIATERRSLTDAQTAARADAVRRRAEFGQQRANLAILQGDRARIDAAIAGEHSVRGHLAYRRYLKFLLAGR